MDVTFWFDPARPFCWMTSQWIRAVAPSRDLRVDWQPITLLVENGLRPDHLDTEFGRRIHHEDRTDFDVAEVIASIGSTAPTQRRSTTTRSTPPSAAPWTRGSR